MLKGDGQVWSKCVLPKQCLEAGGKPQEVLCLTLVAAVEGPAIALTRGEK
jgi:hypothetical protein